MEEEITYKDGDFTPVPKHKHWRFSPSQLATFLECPRKWAWKYVAGKRTPANASAGLGTLIHKLLEQYLKLSLIHI